MNPLDIFKRSFTQTRSLEINENSEDLTASGSSVRNLNTGHGSMAENSFDELFASPFSCSDLDNLESFPGQAPSR